MTEVFGEDIMEEYILAHGPFQEHVYQKGTLISKKGSQNHYFYLVVRGSVSERVSSDEIVSHQQEKDSFLHSHIVDMGGLAAVENLLPDYDLSTVTDIFASKYSMSSVIQLPIAPLREKLLGNSVAMTKLWSHL